MAKIKAIQEQAASKKKETAEAVAKEKAEALESKTSEREQVEGEINNTAQELAGVESALAEVSAMDLGELDPDLQSAVQAEIDCIQAEADVLKAKMNDLAERKANLDAEITVLGGGEVASSVEVPVEAPTESPSEAPAEAAPEVPAEVPPVEASITDSSEEQDARLLEEFGNSNEMIDLIHRFKFDFTYILDGYQEDGVDKTKRIIDAGNDLLASIQNNPEELLGKIKDYLKYTKGVKNQFDKEFITKVDALQKIPNNSLETITSLVQARIDQAKEHLDYITKAAEAPGL